MIGLLARILSVVIFDDVANICCRRSAENPTSDQCDQLLTFKVAQIFPRVAQKVATAVLT